MFKIEKKVALASLLAAVGIGGAQAAPFADVAVLMDESGSMAGEQAWIKGAITSLDTELVALSLTPNNYASVGFAVGGGPGLTRYFNVPAPGTSNTVAGLTQAFGTAADYQTLTYSTAGGTEDGWAAIAAANQYSFRAGTARNYILVTDEDRDAAQAGLTYAGTLASLTSTNTLLNAIVDATFRCTSTSTGPVIGISSGGACYVADGAGGYVVGTGGSAATGFGNTIADYVDLALASGGAAWDLNLLRAGGLVADSFTAAFVDIKVGEIQNQTPEPGSLALLGLSVAGLAMARRRKSDA
ncbi:MAG: PEP-CTERM sorting domain-containing protein [Candidatus Accumulibacter sp.]|uniref:PEP-CTERM sorting domain-containing protein n=1 Tax=Accumulibacter sp. TaxID=2053492 RepID=UPI001A37B05D|nr:PEP-CTERM sorting domain-containing protein [Accumulibacter sp.]MBL8395492.1 PEP-CTERM sorting domain-containing protein [Accumulibacter sp.]